MRPMSGESANGSEQPRRSPRAEEVLRRGRPLPEDLTISDLDEKETEAFLAALKE